MLAVFIGEARAQAPSPGDINQALQQQRQILQQQEERRREELERLRKGAGPQKQEEERREEPQGDGKNCVPIEKIVFDGAELLTPDIKAALQKPFVGKCMSIVDIMAVIRVVTNWYIDEGYVTTRVYPPEQDLTKRVLTVKVIEGRTESVDIFENGQARSGANTAFPELVGNRLYIRDLEQGLDQINRLPSHDATIRLEEGTKDGYSRVRVDSKKSILPYTTASIDNNGLESTGELQAGGTVYIDDALGLYDSFVISHRGSDVFYEGEKASREFTASLSIPYGYWTLLLSGSYFDYRTQIATASQVTDTGQQVAGSVLGSTGVSRYYTAELDRVVHRDRDSKTRIASFLNFKDTENFIEDIKLGVASRKLNVIGLRLSHDRRILGGLFDASITGHRGVPMFGSLRDEDNPDDRLKAEYTKVSADVSFYRPFNVETLNFAWNVRASGQWSNDNLFSTEQISLGSLYTVRGFKDQSLSGDTGAYVRNELVWTTPYLLPDDTKPYLGRLDLFAAFDAGWLKPDDVDPFESGSVSGIAAGARLAGGYLFGEVAYERALYAPDFIKEDELVRFNAGLQLKW